MRPPIPGNVQGNAQALDQWSHQLVVSICKDIKHSESWDCFECGLPARETLYNAPSWSHLQQSRMNIFIFHLCCAGGPCYFAVESELRAIARQTSKQFLSHTVVPSDSTKLPLTSSCAVCNEDATGDKAFVMSRCGGCRLIRYCSPKCQKGDWPRHKKVCKVIKQIKWAGW